MFNKPGRYSFPALLSCLIFGIGCAATKADLQDSGPSQDETEGTSTDTDPAGQSAGSDGCGEPSSGVSTTLTVGSQTRSFVLYLPSNYDADVSYPLIFAWHGLGGSGALAQYYFGLEEAIGNSAIIAYPDALPRADSGGDTGWELSPYGYDFEFFDAMVTELSENLCIDEARIFSTGHSFGGYMSNSLGCYRAEVHNAIAPVAGGPPYYGDCEAAVGAWITHGTGDDTVDLSQGEDTRDRWLFYNECSQTSEPTDPSPCVSYTECTRDVHWCQHTGGHEWPAFAGAAIWDFFSQQ